MIVRLGSYEVEIRPKWGSVKQKKISGSHYVVMPGDDCKYSMRLINNASTRCDASITLDDDHVGTFRIGPFSSITIERPTYNHKEFTFYEGGSSQSYSAGYKKNDLKNGLVKVVFNPEKNFKHPGGCFRHYDSEFMNEIYGNGDFSLSSEASPLARDTFSYTNSTSLNSTSLGEGITGLSGHSNQKFRDATALDYDDSRRATILVRLVCENKSCCCQRSEVVPLGTRSTRYPEPLNTTNY